MEICGTLATGVLTRRQLGTDSISVLKFAFC